MRDGFLVCIRGVRFLGYRHLFGDIVQLHAPTASNSGQRGCLVNSYILYGLLDRGEWGCLPDFIRLVAVQFFLPLQFSLDCLFEGRVRVFFFGTVAGHFGGQVRGGLTVSDRSLSEYRLLEAVVYMFTAAFNYYFVV